MWIQTLSDLNLFFVFTRTTALLRAVMQKNLVLTPLLALS